MEQSVDRRDSKFNAVYGKKTRIIEEVDALRVEVSTE